MKTGVQGSLPQFSLPGMEDRTTANVLDKVHTRERNG